MTMPVNLDDAIHWYSGMLLEPQHFQQHDIYLQQQARQQLELLQPWYWGLMDLALDPERLNEGTIKIDRLRAVMPDGLLVSWTPELAQAGQVQGELSLELAKLDLTGGLKVYLTVPARAPAAASDQAAVRRYDSVSGPEALDENTGDNPMSIKRLRPRVRLVAGKTPPAHYVSFPLCCVERSREQVVLGEYHPPLLRLEASRFLGEHSLQKCLERFLLKARGKLLRLGASAGVHGRERLLIASALPELEVLTHSGAVHPFELYRTLARLVGALQPVDPAATPPPLGGYAHEGFGAGLLKIIQWLERLIEAIPVRYRPYEFERLDEQRFVLDLEDSWDVDRLLVEVTPGPGQTVEHVERWLQTAFCGAEQRMRDLEAQRSPCDVERLKHPEHRTVTERSDALLYHIANWQLSVDGHQVWAIERGSRLIIKGAGRLSSPLRITLFRQAMANGS